MTDESSDESSSASPRVTVVMPVYNQAAFITRAIESLLVQTLSSWELRVVDDGSTDGTMDRVTPYLSDPRIGVERFEQNRGFGAALNAGLASARGTSIAYLPGDDVYYANHLETLVSLLDSQSDAIVAISGVRHHYNKTAERQIDGYPLQLVQTMHRRTADHWVERDELESDDLDRLFWNRLREHGSFAESGLVTCEWVDHPHQRHKIMQEPIGGINPFRQYYDVRQPLRYHTTTGNPTDEVEYHRRFRERPDTPMATDGLKILLVGELAYNAERVLALEERGHTLYGLWMPEPYWYNTVGPVPFGHVEDLPRDDWETAIRRLQPDVIYALLNWQAVPFAHHVMSRTRDMGIPFVWHFKEGPFICLEKGIWRELVDLTTRSSGQIYSSPEMRDWMATVVPSVLDSPSMILDGDLPKIEWFEGESAPRLRRHDGSLHTVVPGRPIGMHPWVVEEMARQDIHLHFYGNFTHGQWWKWIDTVTKLAPDHLHLHSQVDQSGWLREFSRYDAGWLHFEPSHNQGDIRRATWDDLNYPARMATLAVAGLPMLQYDNTGSIFATQTLSRAHNLGFEFRTMEELRACLADEARATEVRGNVWEHRHRFAFDTWADDLVAFFRSLRP